MPQAPGTHLELLKRSRRILLFLAQRAVLTRQDLDMLWSHHGAGNEATCRELCVIVRPFCGCGSPLFCSCGSPFAVNVTKEYAAPTLDTSKYI